MKPDILALRRMGILSSARKNSPRVAQLARVSCQLSDNDGARVAADHDDVTGSSAGSSDDCGAAHPPVTKSTAIAATPRMANHAMFNFCERL